MPDARSTRSVQFLAGLSIVAASAVTAAALWCVFGGPRQQVAVDVATRMTDAVPPVVAAVRPTPRWIWTNPDDQTASLERTVSITAGTRCTVRFACDNHGELFVNGERVAQNDDWAAASTVDVTKHLREGANALRIDARNDGGVAAVIAELEFKLPDGSRRIEVTDEQWTAGLAPARVVATLGDAPWGTIAGFGPLDIDRGIRVPDGFVCELVCAIPRDRGSIVALAAAKDGTLVASGQTSGLLRIDPCASGGDPETTRITPIDVPGVPQFGGAQGLVFRGDDLYAVVNAPVAQGLGLYRLRDHNHDGTFDRVELLRKFPGDPSEHGPHGIVNGPDGDMYVVCGNHVQIPAPERSRLARHWDEDQLTPRMWDPNGHAVGILAPGGWICRTDPDGKSWELVAAGMRNAYDIAFSPEGELFTFDADMEWDMGAPWYRPTRVLHCVSGAEFGWRSGSGKWPAWYADSLPATVDIGPSSPTGILFGTDLAFPEPWRSALFLCDWTFGTIHAVTLAPDGASFQGTREIFLSGKPLPVTDVVASPRDGAMYFAIGGRGAASSIYRVRWTGAPAPKPAALVAGADARTLRHSLEAFHRDDAPATAIDEAWPHLASKDRFIRYAARTVLEHQPVERWADRGLADERTLAFLETSIALARCGAKDWQPKLLIALTSVQWDPLSVDERRTLLRATALSVIRHGKPADSDRLALVAQLESRFPCDDFAANRDLCDLLVVLGSRKVVARAVPLLERADANAEQFDESLLRRSDSYGSVILRMSSQSPQREQVHMAVSLRSATEGWTDDLRQRYFGWFRRMQRTSGGNSFAGFLEHARKDALAIVPEAQRARFDRLSREDEQLAADLPRAEGPGRHWTVDEVVALASPAPASRDFKRGELMFKAANCATCHRFVANSPTGGGPDLTGVGNRFGARELAEAIVEPSRVISDQYRMTEFDLKDGTLVVGRLVDEDAVHVHIVENLLNRDAVRELGVASITARRPSTVSPMLPGMVDGLSRDELADLMAYLLSGGDARAAVFVQGAKR